MAVFDADGVFLRTNRPGRYLEVRYGLTQAKLSPFLARLDDCLVGKADMKDILPEFLPQWGIAESVDEFLEEAFNSGSEVDLGVVERIEAVRARGITCCLATNQDKHRMAYLDRHMRIRQYFDRTYVSCEMGAKKPDHNFYDAIGEQWHGRKMVFWDDRAENVDAARMCGWTAFVFKDVETLKNDLAGLLT